MDSMTDEGILLITSPFLNVVCVAETARAMAGRRARHEGFKEHRGPVQTIAW
jgi:hypothetical protein